MSGVGAMGSAASKRQEEDNREETSKKEDHVEEQTMPFWRKEAKDKINYKARLEHKQYLAQESPEPVYDLSDCALKNVPGGVFSRIKVIRKEALLLQDNELTALGGGGVFADLQDLKVLDLHNNCLEKLPEDLGHMANLKVLQLQNNKLKQLPYSIGGLKKLETLNLSGNNLKTLPESISGLSNLKTLDLRSNSKLKVVPKELAHLSTLETLLLDQDHITYPAPDLVQEGTEAIMKFLCSECSMDYVPPSISLENKLKTGVNGLNGNHTPIILPSDPYEDMVKGHLEKVEKIREEKKKQALELEHHMLEVQERELELKRQSAQNKKILLDNLVEEETKQEAEVLRFQQIKEGERKKLNDKMNEAEAQSDSLIRELMDTNSRYSDPDRVMAALEEDRETMEKQFTIVQEDVERLKEKEVMRAMQMMMEEELQRKASKRQYEQRQDVIKHALTSTLENDKALEEVLEAKGKQQTELISKLLEDEKYQREAFQALLLQQDHHASEITDQMSKIQNELACLTIVEMKKRDLKVEFELSLMEEKRDQLTRLLLDLMERQKQRAEDLQRIMGEMEEGRQTEQENYWLIQYQKLLDNKPKGLDEAEEKMDSKVKGLLVSCGAEEFLPLFSTKEVTMKQMVFMQDQDLQQIGVHSEYTRKKILATVAELKAQDDRLSSGQEKGGGPASAPPPEEDLPSAPPQDEEAESAPSAPPIETFQSTECVVCLERKCDIIFLPCGHLCSCSACEPDLSSCPLCRANILQRVKI